MQRKITVEEVLEILNKDNIDDTIFVRRENKSDVVIMNLDEYKKLFEINLIEKLKEAEEQIKNGEVIDADSVFKEMREKYGY